MKVAAVGFLCVSLSVISLAQTTTPPASKPQTLAGLEMAVAGIERASSVSLQDCPPGANTQKGMTKPGEEFAVVKMNFKVLPAFKPGPIKKPFIKDVSGTDYFTAVSFVDVGSQPAFSCSFPFRTPAGTKLKSIQIDSLTFDLTPFEGK